MIDLPSGVVFFVGFNQLAMGDMGVDLGGRDVCVAQHHLHGTKIGTPFEQMRRKRVSQAVGGDLFF
jgi:hypothetical protein